MEEINVRPKRWSPKLLGWLGLGVLAIVVVGLLSLGGSAPPRQTLKLPDGATVALLGVTYGPQTLVLGTPWQRLLQAVLPSPLKERSGARVLRGGSAGTLTFWTAAVVKRSGGYMGDSVYGIPFDEHGCTGPPVYYQGLGSNEGQIDLTSFPRRSQHVGVRFYVRSYRSGSPAWTHLGELRARNPAPGPYPQWSAAPLPASAAAGEVGFTLKEFRPAPRPKEFELYLEPGNIYWTARFRVTENGKLPAHWSASLTDVRDATGNQWSSSGVGYLMEPGGDTRIYFTGPTCSDEAALKLRVTLTRGSAAKYDPKEVWTVRGIPLPGPKEIVALGRKATVNGVPLEFTALYGPKAPRPREMSFMASEAAPVLLLRTDSRAPSTLARNVLRATDDRGRPVEVQPWYSTGDGQKSTEGLKVTAQPGARSFDLVYAVHAIRQVELLVPNGGRQ